VNPYAVSNCDPPPPPPPPSPTYAELCTAAGGVVSPNVSGDVCECTGSGVDYLEPTIDPNMNKCQIVERVGNAPVGITVCGKKYALKWNPLSEYGDGALLSDVVDLSTITCQRSWLGWKQISWNVTWSPGNGPMACKDRPGLWDQSNWCQGPIDDIGNYFTSVCGC
jgi:hypothetical protein